MKKIILSALLLASISFYGQADTKNQKYVPPVEARLAFEKEFPKSTSEWRLEYGGDDDDEQLYVADFTMQGTKVSAYYNLRGEMQVLEHAVTSSQIPAAIKSYLKKNYPNYKIVEAVKVRDSKMAYTYEIGLQNDSKFYDAVFDDGGDFLQMVEKDH